MKLTDSQIDAFEQQGAVLIKGALNEWVEPLRKGIEKNLVSPGPFVRDYDEKENGRFFGDYCNWQRFEEYRTFLYDSPAADIAGQLMRSTEVRLFHEHVLVKETSTAIPTPWHHDQPYYCVDGKQNCSLWLSLDTVPRETAVEFVAGSHRWNKWFLPQRFDRTPLYEDSRLETLPDIENNLDQYQILGWATEPGDVVAFHYLTLHGAPANASAKTRRRAFSSRWVGEDATFAVRGGKTSPPFPDCKLRHGEPLTGDEFPLVRSRHL